MLALAGPENLGHSKSKDGGVILADLQPGLWTILQDIAGEAQGECALVCSIECHTNPHCIQHINIGLQPHQMGTLASLPSVKTEHRTLGTYMQASGR